MVALWMPNAASESLEKKKFVVHLSRSSWPRTPGPATAFPNLILVQNEPPMVALWLPNAASESLEKKEVCVHLSRSSWPRTPGPATAFPNLILVQTMVALWVPDAASESLDLEKKNKFLSICLGHPGPEHLAPPRLFPI